ncbi:hypothetical protein HS088_TW21G01216 [Tripterygium wilfordii]|uniref:Senescence regulator n=1 Tax=Tripterygium wilfordii TaxID=458696 RepID=A0A7J7C4H4_TRIWF|nr:uncharacterized protein LOC119989811 [Tripterygium wilfordii]KAF5729059.1 hypothetical protein HS088_TW21G01216 [Tripterygium wilfordii]
MMANWDGTISKSNGGYRRKSVIDDEEFEEEEVWSVMKGREYSSSNMRKSKNSSSSSSSSSAWSLPGTKPRMIPRGPEANNDDVVVQQSSVPLNIPDWSKIYGKNGKNMGSWVDDGYHANGYDDHENADDDDDDDDGEEGLVPPHEWIARKLARSQISSFSVCEGVGRTLKGRDLSRVRNAILTKTGFLE